MANQDIYMTRVSQLMRMGYPLKQAKRIAEKERSKTMGIYQRPISSRQLNRKFGGKVYGLWTTLSYKRMANDIASRLRKDDNYLARIVKVPDGWAVYYRKK